MDISHISHISHLHWYYRDWIENIIILRYTANGEYSGYLHRKVESNMVMAVCYMEMEDHEIVLDIEMVVMFMEAMKEMEAWDEELINVILELNGKTLAKWLQN